MYHFQYTTYRVDILGYFCYNYGVMGMPYRILLTLVICLLPVSVLAMRPFVTDDARVIKKDQLETETYIGATETHSSGASYELRSLAGLGLTDRFELVAGGTGLQYAQDKVTFQDVIVQPKYVLLQSLGPIPSFAISSGILAPLNTLNKLTNDVKPWTTYQLAEMSWFLFSPQDGSDPYNNGLTVHLNLGTKGQVSRGQWRNKVFWAGGFETQTFTPQVHMLAEVFNGDPFNYAEEFPAYQTGIRWYRNDHQQFDLVFRGISDGGHTDATGTETRRGWNYTMQIGVRIVLNDVWDWFKTDSTQHK